MKLILHLPNWRLVASSHEINESQTLQNDHNSSSDDMLLAYMAGRTPNGSSPGDIRKVLASKTQPTTKSSKTKAHSTEVVPETILVDGHTYHINKGETISYNGHQYSANPHIITYNVGEHHSASRNQALIDRGANGCVLGNDMVIV